MDGMFLYALLSLPFPQFLTCIQIMMGIYSESDYAVLTRDFEDHVDDKVLEAVRNAAAQQTAAATAVSTVATAPAAPATSEM